eukprot:CAMPEP_0170113146 /NCGR_PEP_ID=MMETSP0020_2-20130122/9671_1 /TAXON_ID=98059 /ORGANISM="Dinobryon sp., Strain UTEXLB2267" /LENGTH=135 /DNA_ID=CAMNT_0010339359 /DNA_START=352 /DNA_END=759 /DNA_ORIENTATION=-
MHGHCGEEHAAIAQAKERQQALGQTLVLLSLTLQVQADVRERHEPHAVLTHEVGDAAVHSVGHFSALPNSRLDAAHQRRLEDERLEKKLQKEYDDANVLVAQGKTSCTEVLVNKLMYFTLMRELGESTVHDYMRA